LSHLPSEELVRRLVVLRHRIGRLEAETRGDRWNDPVTPACPQLAKAHAARAARTEAALAQLNEVVRELALARIVPTAAEVVRRMTKLRGSPFRKATLYRPAYLEVWTNKPSVADRSPHPADAAFGASDARGMTRRDIVYHILRDEKRLAVLDAARNAALLVEPLE
jgi:hypothetical protein